MAAQVVILPLEIPSNSFLLKEHLQSNAVLSSQKNGKSAYDCCAAEAVRSLARKNCWFQIKLESIKGQHIYTRYLWCAYGRLCRWGNIHLHHLGLYSINRACNSAWKWSSPMHVLYIDEVNLQLRRCITEDDNKPQKYMPTKRADCTYMHINRGSYGFSSVKNLIFFFKCLIIFSSPSTQELHG